MPHVKSCAVAHGAILHLRRNVKPANSFERNDTRSKEKTIRFGWSFLWLPLLGLDGVCAAAANELAFGGCAPPISQCETGKLFNSLIHLQSSFAVLSEEINILLIAPH